jgi:hypothetical protein
MLWINGPSDRPCFICGSKDRTVDVNFRDKTFRGVLCMDDLYDKITRNTDDAEHELEVTGGGEAPARKSA